MQGSNDLIQTKQEVYDGGKKEILFLSFRPKIALALQSCAPQILLLLGWRKEIAIYIFTPQPSRGNEIWHQANVLAAVQQWIH